MSRFEEIKRGLLEAIAYERGESVGAVQIHKMSISSVPEFTPEEIRQIRINAEMTQATFAACIGVSKKAVEGWEGGRSHPDGAARRTIGLFQTNPRYADEVGIIER